MSNCVARPTIALARRRDSRTSVVSRRVLRVAALSVLAAAVFPSLALGAPDEETSLESAVPPVSTESTAGFAGPDSVPVRVARDTREESAPYTFAFLEDYHDWKEDLATDTGFSFGIDYYAVALKATDSVDGADDHAAGGVFRFTGLWEAVGRGTDTRGNLNFLFEHRDSYTDTRPNELSINNLGSVGAIRIPFDDDAWHLTNLYWSQAWEDGDFEVVVGWLDITDFVDVYALTSPWTDFSNFAFSIGAATMDLPDDGALGLAAGAWLTDQWYAIGGIEDLNSDPGDPIEGFNTLFKDHETFTHFELGWTPSKDQLYIDNVHLTVWHADERDDAQIESGQGAIASITRSFADDWFAFTRVGYSEDGGSFLERSVSVGVGYQPNARGDYLGIGANWGQTNDAVFPMGRDDQGVIETYYRWQPTKELSITPGVQLLIDPAFNPDKDKVWVFGLSVRLAL